MFSGKPKRDNRSLISYFRLSHDDDDSQPDETSSEALLTAEEVENAEKGNAVRKPRPSSARRRAATYGGLALLTLCNMAVCLTTLRLYRTTDARCMQRSAVWSPVWDDVSPAYTPVRFNGTLDAPSEFRGPPSAAVDEAWSGLDDVGSVALDEETFLRAGGSTENSRMPDELGGGYMADVEVLHQMHCLNFVRMAAYADHYRDFAPEWRDSNRTFHLHLDHCIEMIRTNLLCQADGGIIPFRWVEGYRRPLPDFSTPHKCRDWQGVLQWAKDREVAVPPGYRWAHQPWEKVFPRPAWMPPAA